MLLLWLACATTDDSNAKLPGTTATDAIDERVDPADFPEVSEGMEVWRGGAVTVPAFLTCTPVASCAP